MKLKIIPPPESKAVEINQLMNIAATVVVIYSPWIYGWTWIESIDISIKKSFTSRAFDISKKDLAIQSQSQPGDQFYGIHVSNNGKVIIFAVCLKYKVDLLRSIKFCY